MRKMGYFLAFISFFMFLLVVSTTSFAWECVGPGSNDCLACHGGPGGQTPGSNPYPDGYLHVSHSQVDCMTCHCGVEGVSPCPPEWGPNDTYCCNTCHDKCLDVNKHTWRDSNDYDCGSCHFPPGTPGDCLSDMDIDDLPDDSDNCPEVPNSPNLGTCVKVKGGMTVSYRVGDPKDYITCTSDAQCEATEGTCDMAQGNCNATSCGDVCECYMDCNNSGAGDGKVTGSDLGVLKNEYGRFDCSELDPCYADGSEDGKVTGLDLGLLKNEYGRFDCPACP